MGIHRMKTIVTTSRGVYRCTRYFDALAQSDHIMIENRRTFLGIPIGWRQVDVQEATKWNESEDDFHDFRLDAKFCVHQYEQGLVTSALLKNL